MLANSITQSQYEQFKNEADVSISNSTAPDFGEWFLRMKLMRKLDENHLLQNSDTSFTAFYNQNENGTLGQILAASKAIELFRNAAPDVATFDQRYADAIATNNQINSSLAFEQNEKEVNSLIIKTHYYGHKSLNSQDKEAISFYAHSCPHVAGTAVYKAQSLWAFFNPGEVYNQDSLCQNNSNKLIHNQAHYTYSSRNQISIFPNPTVSELTIKYNYFSDGMFRLYNSFGNEVYRTDLPKATGSKKISIPSSLDAGLYYYKGSFNDENLMGKLTILR